MIEALLAHKNQIQFGLLVAFVTVFVPLSSFCYHLSGLPESKRQNEILAVKRFLISALIYYPYVFIAWSLYRSEILSWWSSPYPFLSPYLIVFAFAMMVISKVVEGELLGLHVYPDDKHGFVHGPQKGVMFMLGIYTLLVYILFLPIHAIRWIFASWF